MAQLGEALFERGIVLDDAIMDQSEPAGLVEVRVCVGVSWRSVRRPARMADASGAGQGRGRQRGREPFVDLADTLEGAKLAVRERAHARGIVAAIFQPPQSPPTAEVRRAFDQCNQRCRT